MMRFSGDYAEDWPEIAHACKKAANWRCIRCGWPNERESGHVLTVHHFDGDKTNNRWWNLGSLCQKCHLHIQGKVIMGRPYMFEHTEWFKPYVAGYYAHQNGEPDDRETVMANLDRLLDYGRAVKKYQEVA